MQIKKTLTPEYYVLNACSCLGSRYYNPRESVWLSVDPPLINGKYMSDEYIGGVFNSENLNPYIYTYQNPIRLIDPDGEAPNDIIIRGKNNSSVTLKTDLINVTVNASSLGADFKGNYTLEGEDVLSAGLDIVGVFDPSGIADGLNVGLQAKKGNWWGAGISLLGVVPYVGDIAKVGKIGKDIEIIKKAVDAVRAGSLVVETIQKTGESLHYKDDANKGKAQNKGERGFTKKTSGTDNPYKHLKPDPNKSGNVIYKHPQTGKKVSRPASPKEKEHFRL